MGSCGHLSVAFCPCGLLSGSLGNQGGKAPYDIRDVGKSANSNWFELARHNKEASELGRKPHMYTRVNMLIRKFHKCSTEVKIRLFRAYCICPYGAALWTRFAAESLNKFRRCYHKSIKMFFLGTANITVSLLY